MKFRISMLLVVMAVFAVPSFAQYDHQYHEREIMYDDGGGDTGGGGGVWLDTYNYENGSYFDNPCTAAIDWGWYAYNLSVEQAGKEVLSGLNLQFNEQTSISGSYSVNATSESRVIYNEPVEIRQYRRANWYDQFHLVTVMRFDPATRDTTLSMEAVCGDGMPDSFEP